MRIRTLTAPRFLPALDKAFARQRPADGLAPDAPPVRILLLYGSLRPRSFSRLAVEEAARLLQFFGAETRIFDPSDLPFPDQISNDDHPAIQELRALSQWSEGQVWCSPERHGQITGLIKAQIDHLPLEMDGMRPTQGRSLAVMQVSGGSQSFNAVNTLRLLGRWMRMFTIPNQSSIARAFQEFDQAGRMKPSPYHERIVDVMEELVRFTVLMRPHVATLTDRYSERKAAGLGIDVVAGLSESLSPNPPTKSTNMTEKTYNILVLCTGNSARSIMAEALINTMSNGRFKAYSAGSHPAGKVNPFAAEKLQSIKYPTENLRSKSWDEFALPDAPKMDFIITVCDNAAGEMCPVWPGQPISAHWGFEDPAAVEGTDDQKRRAFDMTFRHIMNRVRLFVNLPLKMLDQTAIKRELANIGNTTPAE